ncbi:MAG: magnesium transporter [Limnobacter sp.]|nr:magnesium transporter [Limnobacter sp.]
MTKEHLDYDDEAQHSAPKDLDDAQRALAEVQGILRRQEVVESVVHNQQGNVSPEKQQLVEAVVHRQHLNELGAKLESLHPADAAYVLESLPLDERLVVWDLIRSDRDGDILLEVSDSVRETLIRSMDSEELFAATESLDADEIAELAPDLPRDVVEKLASSLSLEEREQLRAAMSYPEESVGAHMDFDMVTIRDDVTLEVVLRYLRRFDEMPEQTDQVFVVDRMDYFKGSLPLDRLLINEPDSLVADVMNREVLMLDALDDMYEAAQAFERYDLVSAPVLDPSGKLIGRITVDEVLDVIREEADADILSSAGLREEEDLFASVWQSAKNRWLWLALNLCTAFFASRVIGTFEGTISKVVALATLMPIVAGIAGNSGNQTMTLIIRSLALGQISSSNLALLFKKELGIAAMNGFVWGSVAGFAAFALYYDSPHGPALGILMAMAIVLNLLVGAIIGISVPVCLEKAGRDPAMGASVLLTFTTDSMGFLIFLGLATIFFS